MIKEKVLKRKIYKDNIEKNLNIVIKLLSVFILLFFFCGCSKNRISKDVFISKMSDKKYSVVDLSNGDSTLVLAVGDYYQVYYYAFLDCDTASSYIKKEVNALESSLTKITKKVSHNYEKYQITSSSTYTVYIRVDNTYIYISAPNKYRSDVIKMTDYIGY